MQGQLQQPQPQTTAQGAYTAWYASQKGMPGAGAARRPAASTSPSSPQAAGHPAAASAWDVLLAAKYPACLHVSLEALPRPDPSLLASIAVSNAGTGLQLNLPAGYGSGYELGRWCMPRPSCCSIAICLQRGGSIHALLGTPPVSSPHRLHACREGSCRHCTNPAAGASPPQQLRRSASPRADAVRQACPCQAPHPALQGMWSVFPGRAVLSTADKCTCPGPCTRSSHW